MRLLTLTSLDNSLKLPNFAIITLFQFVGSMYFSEYKDTTKFWKSVILWAFYKRWETLVSLIDDWFDKKGLVKKNKQDKVSKIEALFNYPINYLLGNFNKQSGNEAEDW